MKKLTISIAALILVCGQLISFESDALMGGCYSEYNAMTSAQDAAAADPTNSTLANAANHASAAYALCLQRQHARKETGE